MFTIPYDGRNLTLATRSGIDTRVARAMTHPVRVKALEILNSRVASPSDIARELDLPVANVSYHINTLLRLKCIEEVETRHVRGSIEHRYRALRRAHTPLAEWETMPVVARHSFVTETARNAFSALRMSLDSGVFDTRDDTHITWTPVRLDDEGFKRIYGMLTDVLDAVLEEQAASAQRLAESGEEGVLSSVAMFQHPVPPRFTTDEPSEG